MYFVGAKWIILTILEINVGFIRHHLSYNSKCMYSSFVDNTNKVVLMKVQDTIFLVLTSQ